LQDFEMHELVKHGNLTAMPMQNIGLQNTGRLQESLFGWSTGKRIDPMRTSVKKKLEWMLKFL
jgi:hypothetical protein